MRNILFGTLVTIVYVAFYSLIGLVCYYTKSAWPLWALIFSPSYSFKEND